MWRFLGRQLLACLTVATVAMVPAAQAAPIVYTVFDQIGSISISGTLTTDGTIGTNLGSSIFTDFSLTVTNGVTPTLFTTANAFIVPQNTFNVTATATELSLGAIGRFTIFDTGNAHVWGVMNFGLSSQHVIQNPLQNYGVQEIAVTTTFAVVQTSSNVPEPASLALLASGLFGLSAASRRRSRAARSR